MGSSWAAWGINDLSALGEHTGTVVVLCYTVVTAIRQNWISSLYLTHLLNSLPLIGVKRKWETLGCTFPMSTLNTSEQATTFQLPWLSKRWMLNMDWCGAKVEVKWYWSPWMKRCFLEELNLPRVRIRCKGDCRYIIPHKCPSRELRKYETTLQPFSVLLFPQSSYVVVGRLWDDPKVPSVPQPLIFRSCFWHTFQPLLKVGRGLPKYQLCRPYIPRSALFRKAHTALALRSSTESEDLSYENYPGSENNIEKPIQKCVLCY